MKFKLFALMFVCILLISSVSAFEINPFATKKIVEESITINENDFMLQEFSDYPIIKLSKTFLWIETDRIAEYKIVENECGFTNCRMNIKVRTYSDEVLFDDEMKYLDLIKGGDTFLNTQYYLRGEDKTYKIDVSDYKYDNCRNVFNPITEITSEKCDETFLGTHQEDRVREIWTPYNQEVLPSGEYEIELRGRIKVGQSIDVIPYAQNKEFSEWAVWTSALNVSLMTYLAFDDGAGLTANNSFNTLLLNATIGNDVQWNLTNKKLGASALQIRRETDRMAHINSTVSMQSTAGFTINTWAYRIQNNTDLRLYGQENSLLFFGWDGATNQMQVGKRGSSSFSAPANTTINMWEMWSLVVSSGNYSIYQNGLIVATGDVGVTSGTSPIKIGNIDNSDSTASMFNGTLDEYAIWNRTLTAQEVLDLWNGGDGLPFTAPIFLTASFSSPPDNFATTDTTPDLSCNFTSVGSINISNVTIEVFDSSNNLDYTNTDTTPGGITQSFNKTWTTSTLTDDSYNWSCSVFGDDSSNAFTGNRSIIIDTINPSINLTAPSGDQGSFVIGNNLSVNWTVSDTNLDSCWFDYNSINTTVTCGANNFSFITIDGQQSLIFYANDTAGNLGSNTTSWTYSFLENNITFNNLTFETSNQDFILNLTTDETILSISGNLNYNGTNHLSTIVCNSGNCLLSNNIDVPIVQFGSSQVNDFFWNFTIFNGTSSNNIQTSTNQQTVNKTFLEICNGTHTIKTLNFTALDEINLSRINNFQFDSTFNFWIGGGTVKRNNTYSLNATEVNLCMKDDLNYSVDAKIDYDEAGNTTTYVSRFYYFQNESINGTREDISLYLLQSAFSTSFILKVQDQNLLPVEETLINIQRCYADELDCRTVQIAKTDENGKSIGFFQTETVDYKFIIVKNGETLLETGLQKVVPETSPFTLTFNIGQDLGAPWKGSEDIPSLNSSLVFDKDTGIVTYVYIDTSTNFTFANLTVTRNSLSNSSATVDICSDLSTLSSSTIFCDVGNTTGFYTASGFITRSGTALDKQISFQIEDVSSIVGFLGLFYGFFLMLVLIFMFKFNEIAGIWLLVVSIVLLNISGLIKFGMVFVTAIIVLAIIITWLLER